MPGSIQTCFRSDKLDLEFLVQEVGINSNLLEAANSSQELCLDPQRLNRLVQGSEFPGNFFTALASPQKANTRLFQEDSIKLFRQLIEQTGDINQLKSVLNSPCHAQSLLEMSFLVFYQLNGRAQSAAAAIQPHCHPQAENYSLFRGALYSPSQIPENDRNPFNQNIIPALLRVRVSPEKSNSSAYGTSFFISAQGHFLIPGHLLIQNSNGIITAENSSGQKQTLKASEHLGIYQSSGENFYLFQASSINTGQFISPLSDFREEPVRFLTTASVSYLHPHGLFNLNQQESSAQAGPLIGFGKLDKLAHEEMCFDTVELDHSSFESMSGSPLLYFSPLNQQWNFLGIVNWATASSEQDEQKGLYDKTRVVLIQESEIRSLIGTKNLE